MGVAPSPLDSSTVRVSFFDADAHGGLDAAAWTRLRGWLQSEERARLERFGSLEARASFLIGRGLARRLLADAAGGAPADWRFVDGPRGRPEIESPASPLRFNIAHSGGMVACVVAHDRAVGVDVEHLDRRPLGPEVPARVCAPAELADIEAEPAPWLQQRRFLAYWTLKEAYLKARGIGISVPLADAAFTLDADAPRLVLRGTMANDDPRWTFRLAQPGERHFLAVAASSVAGEPRIEFDRFLPERFQ